MPPGKIGCHKSRERLDQIGDALLICAGTVVERQIAVDHGLFVFPRIGCRVLARVPGNRRRAAVHQAGRCVERRTVDPLRGGAAIGIEELVRCPLIGNGLQVRLRFGLQGRRDGVTQVLRRLFQIGSDQELVFSRLAIGRGSIPAYKCRCDPAAG